MELINYLKQFGIAQLQDEFNIKAVYSIAYPELVTLCYDHTKTSRNSITNECRGIVLDKNTFEIKAYPFSRFGDYDPKKTTDFDFSDFKCFEKIDGSLIILYFYAGKWQIGTKSMPDGRGKIAGLDQNYEQMFWELWHENGFALPTRHDFTYLFELKFPSNRQYITQTTTKSIALIGLRNIQTFEEVDIETAVQTHLIPAWNLVVSKPMTSISDIWEHAIALNPSVDEGFVLLDKKFNRLKVKSPAYELIALLRRQSDDPAVNAVINRDNFKRLIKIAKYSTDKAFLSRYSNCETDFERIIQAKSVLMERLEHILKEVHSLEGAAFGQYCKKSPFQKFVFHLKKVANVPLFLKQGSEDAFVEMMTVVLKTL
jgi:RNA ligase